MSVEAPAPSFDQINEQADAGHGNATILLQRSDGTISTGRYRGEQLSNGRYKVEVTTADGEAGYKAVPMETLTDAKQVELAKELAGSALDAVSIQEPESAERTPSQEEALLAKYKKLIDGLSEHDQSAVWNFAIAVHAPEMTAARGKMSLGLQRNTDLLLEAQRIWAQISAIREANRAIH